MKNSLSFLKVPYSFLNHSGLNLNLYQRESSGSFQVVSKLGGTLKEFKSQRIPLFISKEDKNSFIEYLGQMSGGLGDGFSKDQVREASQFLSPIVEMICLELHSQLPSPIKGPFQESEDMIKQTVLDIASTPLGLSIILRLLCSHDYLIKHSFLVCSLSFSLANELSYSSFERKSIAQGALLHDIGMLRIDEEIYTKPNLSEEDWSLMKAHPQVGEKMLAELEHMGAIVLDIIAGHHSQANGRGYGRAGTEFAHLVGTLDAFATMIIATPYRSLPLTPFEAWESLKEDEGHFERTFVQLLKDTLIQPHLKKAS